MPRILRWLVSLCVFAIFMLGVGFLAFATHVATLDTPENPRKADAIIVLTGGLYRLDAGVSLLNEGRGDRLLISGVNPKAGRDDLRAATGGDRELFSCCVDIDHAAMDTIGNAEESGKWMQANHYRSVILVTNNYHMPRSLLEMRRILHDVDIQPYPVVNTSPSTGSWFTDPDALRVIATEYVKFLGALTRGWTGLPYSTSSGVD
ncbi:YdcF family protein [Tianweitania sp. BSSL-BM11]|uniref:YdcF family protein n=1 Tax=Tianweitania aestuarii TaxID=2814886 RepID=A0ABS5RZN3_9HYPH|nr:YdcF family protein [Tianweitania aestuarii]MBS9722514.1 YdcF family protein [Tianweitania aestuarii]